jgi:hypothetical protein
VGHRRRPSLKARRRGTWQEGSLTFVTAQPKMGPLRWNNLGGLTLRTSPGTTSPARRGEGRGRQRRRFGLRLY